MIWFNGKSADDVNVVCEHFPTYTMPRRKAETASIAGRSGDVLLMQNAFENVIASYDIYIRAPKIRLPNAVHKVMDWLYQDGYCRLEDTYDVDTYREAFFLGDIEVENCLNRFGRATIQFSAKPQRWLKNGDIWLVPVNGTKLINPTQYTAKPLIKVTGNGTLTIGSKSITIAGVLGDTFLDCDTENAYSTTESRNNKTSGTFPDISGAETISWTGFSAVSLKPRWWML